MRFPGVTALGYRACLGTPSTIMDEFAQKFCWQAGGPSIISIASAIAVAVAVFNSSTKIITITS